MKLVKKFVCAVLFVSALSISAYAGDLETPGYAPPPPPDHSMSCSVSADESAGGSSVSSESIENPSADSFYDAFMAVMSLF